LKSGVAVRTGASGRVPACEWQAGLRSEFPRLPAEELAGLLSEQQGELSAPLLGELLSGFPAGRLARQSAEQPGELLSLQFAGQLAQQPSEQPAEQLAELPSE
jgi:hypothetical protein